MPGARGIVGALVAALLALSAAGSASAATLKANYQLQGDLTSAVGGAPSLADLGGGNRFVRETVDGVSRQVLRFPQGGGLALGASGLVDPRSFSVVLLFRLDELNGFRRILDFSDSTADNGFYDYSGGAVVYGSDGGPARSGIVFDDSYAQVVLTSAPAGDSQRVVVYVNGAEVVAATAPKDFDLGPGTLRLFQDNVKGPAGGEESAGALACLLVYDGALGAEEIDQLRSDPTLCPAPRPTPRRAKAFATGRPELRKRGEALLVDTGLTVRCPIGDTPCSVRGRVDATRAGRPVPPAIRSLGQIGFSLRAGASARVVVPLSGPGARALREAGSLRISASARIKVPGGKGASARRRGRIVAPRPPAFRTGLYTGTTSQRLPIFVSVGPGAVRSVLFRWRARCADGKLHTNTVSFRGAPIRNGRFAFRRALESGGAVRIVGRIRGAHARGWLSRRGASAFGTRCPTGKIRWRARVTGIEGEQR